MTYFWNAYNDVASKLEGFKTFAEYHPQEEFVVVCVSGKFPKVGDLYYRIHITLYQIRNMNQEQIESYLDHRIRYAVHAINCKYNENTRVR